MKKPHPLPQTPSRHLTDMRAKKNWESIWSQLPCAMIVIPKKMGPKGPELDLENALSGHPAALPIPDLDRAELESNGAAASQTMIAWIEPWGVSFSSNITSENTGIGSWTEEQFFTALRQGKSKGIAINRQILPPMPYEMFAKMTDGEIRAIFAYLKNTKPIENVVPQPLPPLSAK